MKRILVIHGPNLNMLGRRETSHYGTQTLSEVDAGIRAKSGELGLEVACIQSDDEAVIVRAIQESRGQFDGIIINPAGFGYSSVAIRDALILAGIPAVEVHLSNIHAREPFRRHTLTAPACIGQICGFKGTGYILAMIALRDHPATQDVRTD